MSNLFIAVILIFSNACTYAGVLTAQQCDPTPCSYSFEGEIRNEDIAEFEKIESSDNVTIVYLNSPGGNAYASIKIAQVLDGKKAMVIIKKGDRCFSSCVIAFAGGVIRRNHGSIGIHSIYNVNVQDSYEKNQRGFAEIETAVKQRLRYSGISESIWSEMQSVPAERIKMLSDKYMTDTRLVGITPAYSDYQEVRLAKNLGITRQELIARRQKSTKVCGEIPRKKTAYDAWSRCDDSIVDPK